MDHRDDTPSLAPDDPRVPFATAVATARGILAAVPAGATARPTPAGMTVGELCEHLVMVLRRVACAGRGEDTETWPVDAGDVAPGGWHDAWLAAAHDVQAAWGDHVLERPTSLPWGEFSGAEVLAVYTNEVTVHTWDLARALGAEPEWDPAAVAVSLAAIRSQLPVADRTGMWAAVRAGLPPSYPWEDPFGPAVPVAADADPIDQLVAWNGRDPGWRGPD